MDLLRKANQDWTRLQRREKLPPAQIPEPFVSRPRPMVVDTLDEQVVRFRRSSTKTVPPRNGPAPSASGAGQSSTTSQRVASPTPSSSSSSSDEEPMSVVVARMTAAAGRTVREWPAPPPALPAVRPPPKRPVTSSDSDSESESESESSSDAAANHSCQFFTCNHVCSD